MKKLFLLLFLMPNLVMAEICFVHDNEAGTLPFSIFDNCNNGDELFHTIHEEKSISSKGQNEFILSVLINRRVRFCNLRYETYIEQVNSKSYLTCVFKDN